MKILHYISIIAHLKKETYVYETHEKNATYDCIQCEKMHYYICLY